METKDWITILIPIVFNGIIAVIFGKYYENKWEIKKYKESKKQKIEDKFYDILIKNKSLFYEMKSHIFISTSAKEFMDYFLKYFFALGELEDYIEQYDLFLHKYKNHLKCIKADLFDLYCIYSKSVNSSLENDENLLFFNDKMVHIEKKLNKILKMYMK